MSKKKKEKKERLKPISLYPLDTEEALKNLFEVKQLPKKKKTKKKIN